jgi:hypothetical protein
MIFTPINTGSAPNDGTGDTPRAAAQKINSGFEEVEARLHDQGEQIAYAKRSIDDVVALAQESAEAAAADRQQTGEDRDAVEAAAIAVAADRVQTGLDRAATHGDAVATAADRTAAAAAAATATDKATIATTKAGEAAGSATAAAGSATAAANSATAAAASAAIADRAAGGSNGQIQFNSAGVLTGSASLIWTGSRLGIGATGGAPGSELEIRKSTGDVNVTLQSDASGTAYINLMGPLVAYGGLRANNGVSEEWRLGGLGSGGTFGVSLAGVERLKINSQSVTIGTSSAPGVALRVGGVIAATGAIRPGSFTVATLPSASGVGPGSQAHVTDASITTYRAVVVGGGSDGVTVTSIGGQWLIGA